ncbi:MAG: dTDP-4-dehydrorhamnose 3,5-epimerase [Treponema sp.]|nr:dTDP-4-dehydrorhamnose 3,5-epimerase [Treponema sp.]
MFEIKECSSSDGKTFEGLYEIQPKIFGDARGYFFESYNKKEFNLVGISDDFVQDNQSLSHKGTLRGLHFQTKHPQAKLVRAISGRLYDVAVDLRSGSQTFGKWYGVILDSEKQNMLYIPKGFAHGFLALTENCIQFYKCTDFYDPKGEGGLMWNDPVIGIDWKSVAPEIEPLLSEKDGNHPAFDKNTDYFDINGTWIKK